MNIKSNASSSEKLSSFYNANKAFCLDIEEYIVSKGGSLKGEFNAWSYLVTGEVLLKKKWYLKYKKATFSSSGNLLLSSEYQSLLVLAEWKTEIEDIHHTAFQIRKKTFFDEIKTIFSKSMNELNPNGKYIVIQKGNKSDLVPKLYQILKQSFYLEEIFVIEYQNNLLRIEFRTAKHNFDILDKIMTEL